MKIVTAMGIATAVVLLVTPLLLYILHVKIIRRKSVTDEKTDQTDSRCNQPVHCYHGLVLPSHIMKTFFFHQHTMCFNQRQICFEHFIS